MSFAELKGIVDAIESDVDKFQNKGNKAAGTRVRKAMQDVKRLAQAVRVDIQAQKNG
jgi:hypothetical protein